jgi:hypothetical protein
VENLATSDRGIERDHDGRVVMGWVLVEALVRAVVIEMVHVLVEDGAGVSFVVGQQPVGALFADTANEPFRVTVGSRRAGRDLDYVDAFGGEDGIECGSELGVSVAKEEAKRSDSLAQVHQEVAGGLDGPGCGRVDGHTENVHPTGTYFHDEQDIEPAQGDSVEG